MKNFLGKRILVLTAHPDDEGYAMAGSIYKNYALGGSVFLLCATYGEKGMSHLKRPVSTTRFSLRKKDTARGGLKFRAKWNFRTL